MAVITNFSDLDLSKEYTYSDYLHWQLSERVELIKGFIRKMSPEPNRFHQTVSRNITGLLFNSFKNHRCKIYVAPFDVRLPIPSKKRIQLWYNQICVWFATQANLTIKDAMAHQN